MATERMLDPIEIEFELDEISERVLMEAPVEDIRDAFQQNVVPILAQMKEEFSDSFVEENLREKRLLGESPSLPSLCSDLVMSTLVAACGRQVDISSQGFDLETFSIWQSLKNGAYDCMEVVTDTEESIRIGINRAVDEESDLVLKARGTPQFPFERIQTKAEIEMTTGLLQRDPSGFTLVDDFRSRAQAEGDSEFYLLGAKIAAAYYKRAYSVAKAKGI